MKKQTWKISVKRFIVLAVFAILVAIVGLVDLPRATPVSAAPHSDIFVNSTGDAAAFNPSSGTCETASGNSTCTLRAAIQVANATVIGAPHTIKFSIPSSDPGCVLNGGIAYVCTITITTLTPLPNLTRDGTVIDGTTQTGYNWGTPVGTGGSVGVGALALGTIPRATIEINFNANLEGLVVSAPNVTLKGFAFYNHTGNDLVGQFGAIEITRTVTSPITLTQLLAGTKADGSDPGVALRNQRASIEAFGYFYINNNYIAFNGRGLQVGGSGFQPDYTNPANTLPANCNSGQPALIVNNEFESNGNNSALANGATLQIYAQGVTACGNLITSTLNAGLDPSPIRGEGIKLFYNAGYNRFENNTLAYNATAGIGLYHGSHDNLITANIINNNGTATKVGAGISIGDATDSAPTAHPSNNHITRNSIYANVGVGNLGLGIDLVPVNDFTTLGVADGPTLNAAGLRTGPNSLYNFPVFTDTNGITLSGGFLTITGYAKPGQVIELFIAAPDPSGFGEGQTYLATVTEGCKVVNAQTCPAIDTDDTTGAYANASGTDDTNKFSFAIPTASLAAAVNQGTRLTMTGTDASGNTSEFGHIGVVGANPTAVRLSSMTTSVSAPSNWMTIVFGGLGGLIVGFAYIVYKRKR